MEIKKNTMIIGLGNCGCKITKLFADMVYSTMFANGSEQDLKVLGNMKGIYKLDDMTDLADTGRELWSACVTM